MTDTYHQKLVRDKIPEIIIQHRATPSIRILETNEEYKQALMMKLEEEIQEVKEANKKEEVGEELADVLEVIYAVGKLHGYTQEEIENIRQVKKEKNGAFEKRIFLIKTEERLSCPECKTKFVSIDILASNPPQYEFFCRRCSYNMRYYERENPFLKITQEEVGRHHQHLKEKQS